MPSGPAGVTACLTVLHSQIQALGEHSQGHTGRSAYSVTNTGPATSHWPAHVPGRTSHQPDLTTMRQGSSCIPCIALGDNTHEKNLKLPGLLPCTGIPLEGHCNSNPAMHRGRCSAAAHLRSVLCSHMYISWQHITYIGGGRGNCKQRCCLCCTHSCSPNPLNHTQLTAQDTTTVAHAMLQHSVVQAAPAVNDGGHHLA